MSALLRVTRPVDFDRLYRRHVPSVYRYAYAVLGSHADAEDVTQQTFLNAYRAIAQGTKPRKPENWLLRIAHNEVRRHFRKAHGKPLEVELDERLPQRAPDESEPSLADVLRALQDLSPIQRSALVMREFEGRSYAEIAELLNMSQSALEAQIFRARRALAEHLEEALTCTAAEEAVLRRVDGRLPRRVARRLKAHLQECHVCDRFAEVQKRQHALLKGLSMMPIPASLFLFRPDQAAAAGVGASAVTVGGSAAVGGGAAGAAGAGATGVAAGFVAKAAAVTAAAAVAGGVGYGVATAPAPVVGPERKAAQSAIARKAPQNARIARVAVPTAQVDQRAPTRQRAARRARKGDKAKAPPAALVVAPAKAFAKAEKAAAKAEKAAAKRPHPTRPTRPAKAGPSKAAATKHAPKAPRARTRPATGNRNARVRPARPKPSQPVRGAQKPGPSPSPKPAPPLEPPRGPNKLSGTVTGPSG
jgi:RNA polymerase sigma factor (sigma-70 family)